ncbi:hypothetical protein DNTS_020703 [Danionella cerebrum]|uniref:Methyltransferase type 11 domain-containing protein n=1 Tax=Danionella cerebrum TaxID=2873325 RepID=A0A553MP30_9TELE|nr:hypothetical protein DNTS_020703 [Danionella translucida]
MTLFINVCVFLAKTLILPLKLAEILGLLSFYKRVFPIIVYNITFSYNNKMNDKKRELFRNLDKFYPTTTGPLRILEVGCGSGANFEHYPTGSKITCTDPNHHFKKYLEKSMAKNDHLVYENFVVASGENLQTVEDSSVDVVVCTLVLCSVQDTSKVLQEAKRVLRPLFSSLSTYYFGDGCETTRATWRDIEGAGFSVVELRHIQAPVIFMIKPHIVGKMTLFMNICAAVVKVLALPLYLAEQLGLLSYYKRFFALTCYTFMGICNNKMRDKKLELFRCLDEFYPTKGSLRILEVGCGSGANFEFYPTGCRVTCTDPNPHFKKYLEKSMAKNDHLVYENFVVASGENLQTVEDSSVDVVVCTLVLCSVQDTSKVLQEAKRVLRPGGAFFFLEHVASDPSTWTYFCQVVLLPFWYYLGDGCDTTRATWKEIEAAGFSEVQLRHVEAPVFMGGALFFLEHVVSDPSSWIYFFQQVLQPLWYYLNDGCEMTRAIWKDLETAGFSNLHLSVLEDSGLAGIGVGHGESLQTLHCL